MKYFFLSIPFLFITVFSNGQGPVKPGSIPVYHCMNNLPPAYAQYMRNNNIMPAPIISGHYIDPTNADIFNEASFKKGIEKSFPNKYDTGVGIIDWETKSFDNLCFQAAENPSFKKSVDLFSHILDIAKKCRPKVRWGIYNIPYVSYWQRNDEYWLKQGELLRPLFDKMDILMLSLYDFYEDGTQYTDDKSYVKDNMKMALAIAEKYQKPLYVFIWDRYHMSNEKKGLQLIPQKEFVSHVHNILQASYNDKKVAGLVWFDAQDWFYQEKPTLVAKDAALLSTTKKAVRDAAYKKYGKLIRETVDAATTMHKKR